MRRKHLFVIVLFAGLFALAVRPAVDPDLGWHLRTGEWIAQTHAIPHQDVFSFTKAGAPWVAHEWLCELLMFGLSRAGGTSALVLFFASLVALAFAIAYARCEARPYAAGLLLLWGAVATIPAWGVRPQMFTLLLASVFLWILDHSIRSARLRMMWWLPALMMLWVNLHAGFGIGIALILVFAAAESISSNGDRMRLKHLAASALACAAAVVVNPNGVRIYAYPFQTLNASTITGYIQEWASPNFHLPIYRLFLLFTVFAVIVLARSHRGPDAREGLLFLFTLTAALMSARHAPFFVLVAVPILSRRMPDVGTAERGVPLRSALHAAVAALVLLAVALHARSVLGHEDAAERDAFPVAAVDFVKQHALPAPIYNNYDWGGYLIEHAYPAYRVFVDGRADVYGDQFLTDTVRTYRVRPGWDKMLRDYNVRTVLIGCTSPLATALRESHDWQLAFEDHQAAVFTRLAEARR